MLYLVLALVLAAFGLLIAALTTATTLWAWISVAVSVAAAGLLVYDWWQGRRAKAAATPAEEPRATVATAEAYEVDDAVDDVAGENFAEDFAGDEPVEPEYVGPAGPLAADAAETTETVVETGEPGEELTDATDLLIVSELDDEVRVVDEHPRYHLVSCSWLVRRSTIPIAVSEARQLGFTPCARCGPDARLAGQHRAAR